ncbi:enoyl-CoA hydratase/isomerase family protein [Arhodomonas aquaeolei]|uniref:enoyl-CoA hydratase/isomerase family protein n=1 Tax=Arhodomonas aquaeolei TaxID=2369 RepID=UPI0003605E9B|nr:enoyl-CoA hydratase/isomerase family protein [Arhodomonas aquaeolei]
MSEQPVIFEEVSAVNGRRVGFARLNAEKALNALNPAMIAALRPQLERWADDPGIACVVLHGAGEKAFCAGGDVVATYRAIQEAEGGRSTFCEQFFEQEYRLDYRIHTYPKPLLVWGHGIVMGGGLGMMVGGSHRVVTEASRIAMPEITIGLYPDVAGTWFLNRMPGRVGLFLGLTGARMNAADALYTSLADYFITAEHRDAIFAALADVAWDDDPELNRGHLSLLLRRFADGCRGERPRSNVLEHIDFIDHVTDRHSVAGILEAMRESSPEDKWLATATRNLELGSPTSARVIFEQFRGGRHLSLKQVFRRELAMSVQCTRRHDFPEGVRALLVDKDQNPRWNPATLAEVDDALVDAHFEAPEGLDPSPLDDLPE